VVGRPVGRLADEDSVHRRRRLQARGGVDDIARRHALALGSARAERDERLAGVDCDPHLELVLLVRPVADRERRAKGTLRVVLVRGGRAEERHHRVADELLDGTAEPLELTAQVRVVGPEESTDVFGIELLGAGGEADEVREEDGHDLALLARGGGGCFEWGAAGAAEAGAGCVLLRAARADGHAAKRTAGGRKVLAVLRAKYA
jgi:hypothetical protein